MVNVILSILISANVHNPRPLAESIVRVANAEQVDAITMTRLVIVESRGNPLAVNSKTGDYGIAQIHLDAHPEIGFMCAMTLDCSLTASAKIIKTLDRICQYNTGKRFMTERRLKKCLTYEKKLYNIAEGRINE